MVRTIAAIAIVLGSAGRAVDAQCEASAPVRQVIERSYLRQESGLAAPERKARRVAILEEGLAGHADDYFLLRQEMNAEDEYEPRLRWAEALHEKHPDRPVYALLHAQALEGIDTPRAIRMLDELKAAHPEMARVVLELDRLARAGRFKDKARADRELEGFLRLCPATLEPTFLRMILSEGTADQIARTAAAVRKRLEAETDPLLGDAWQALWSMEFKTRPPAEHTAVRRRIADDLARLEAAAPRHEAEWLGFLRGGYRSAGDLAAAERIGDEILKEFPASGWAKELARSRWDKRHPRPDDPDKAQKEAYDRAHLAAVEEWHERWPDDLTIQLERFQALAALPDTEAGRIGSAADELLAAARKERQPVFRPPLEFLIADAYLKHRIRLDRIAALVDEGYRMELAARERELADDRPDAEERAVERKSLDFLKLEKARILLALYAELKQPEKARAIDEDLAAVATSDPSLRQSLLLLRAQAAEVEGRKLDALLMYRAALRADAANRRPRGSGVSAADNVERLWKELGGTSAAWALLLDRPQAAEVTDSRWERPSKPLPAFSLSDLEGKTWKLATLRGKAVLINVWATWCGPCRREHPAFQALYDQLKSRQDVAVLSFNVDDDLGRVAPYMKENNYSFPVLPARAVVDAVVPLLGIPRNWFIDPRGKLEWEQVGFGATAAPAWQEMILAKLAEVLKSR